jgi:hypothetical protein
VHINTKYCLFLNVLDRKYLFLTTRTIPAYLLSSSLNFSIISAIAGQAAYATLDTLSEQNLKNIGKNSL